MNVKCTKALILAIALLYVSTLNAQDELPSSGMGISASYQTKHFGIQFPIWLSESITLAPVFGGVYKDNSGSDIQIGISPKFYLIKNKVSPYIGLLGGMILFLPKEGDTTTDYTFGISAGVEYFITKHFSTSIDAQINGTISGENSTRYGNPGGVNLNTGTGFTATIYF
jgi:hypothetical protein